MRTILFSSQTYDRDSFTAAVRPESVQLHFQPARLSLDTAALAHGYEVVCPFINDDLSAPVLEQLADGGTQLIALRSAGFNHVDLPAAKRLGLSVVRVPAYSPHAVAEHAVALILALNRRLHRAYNRTREGDFTLHGLTGFDLVGKTVGVVGTGQIGATFGKIMAGFGCKRACNCAQLVKAKLRSTMLPSNIPSNPPGMLASAKPAKPPMIVNGQIITLLTPLLPPPSALVYRHQSNSR